MRILLILPLVVLLALLPLQAHAENEKPWKAGLIDTNIQAICDKAVMQTYPTKDKPTSTEREALRHCVSDQLYYGIKVPQDYGKARACAFMDNENSDGSGSLMLMMLYANGYGVEKNLDLAIKAACEGGGAPAEIEGRVQHLTELKTKPAGQLLHDCVENKGLDQEYCAGKVDLCDDITSGYMQGVCEARQLAMKEQHRREQVKELIGHWSAPDQAAFRKLNKVAKTYFETRASNEVDQSGTARAALASEEEGALIEHFMATLKSYEAGKLPSDSAEAFAKADHELNDVYAAAIQKIEQSTDKGTMTKEGVRQTQRMWQAYRDAWVAFAAIHYPALSVDSLKDALTRERTTQLKSLPFVM